MSLHYGDVNMKEEELEELIREGESQEVEFKESLKLKDEIGENVSSFSNTNDGVILVGVTDSGKRKGIEMGEDTLEDLANFIKQYTDPHVYPKLTPHKIDDKSILAINVKESSEKPVFFKHHAYKRIGKSTHRLSASEIRELARKSGGKVYWDKQICHEAGLEDIDENRVKEFLETAKRSRDLDIDPEVPVKEALTKLKALKNDKPTNACVLFFGENPQDFFSQAETRCGKFEGTKARKPFSDMKVLDGPISEQVDKAEQFVLDHMKKAAWLEPGEVKRKEKWEYPPDAIREGIVNAICHRDYQTTSNVQIRMLEDRIEIWNPGTLPGELTPESLKREHESIPRNPLIAQLFFLSKEIEKWGTGTNEMVEECIKHGLPEPEFKESDSSFVVTIRKGLTEENLEKMGLNKRQIKGFKYIMKNGSITNREYRKINDVSRDTARLDLSELVDMKLVTRVGKGRSTKYVPKAR